MFASVILPYFLFLRVFFTSFSTTKQKWKRPVKSGNVIKLSICDRPCVSTFRVCFPLQILLSRSTERTVVIHIVGTAHLRSQINFLSRNWCTLHVCITLLGGLGSGKSNLASGTRKTVSHFCFSFDTCISTVLYADESGS
jgi:hypothetical protein